MKPTTKQTKLKTAEKNLEIVNGVKQTESVLDREFYKYQPFYLPQTQDFPKICFCFPTLHSRPSLIIKAYFIQINCADS